MTHRCSNKTFRFGSSAQRWFFCLLLCACSGQRASADCSSCESEPEVPQSEVSGVEQPSSQDDVAQVDGEETADTLELPTLEELETHVVFIDGAMQCTGSLIDERVVLTAWHCVQSNSRVRVVFGRGTQTPMALSVPTDRIFIHPELAYESSIDMYQHDVAVLVLESNPPDFMEPLPIGDPVEVGDLAIATGYGCDVWDATTQRCDTDDSLKVSQIEVSHIEHELLRNVVTWRGDIEASNPCLGDSGGPLLTLHEGQWSVSGISWGWDTLEFSEICLDWGLYGHAADYQTWIAEAVCTEFSDAAPLLCASADRLNIE